MARINGSLDMQVVTTMRGHVDFYRRRGVAIARAWPRISKGPPTAGTLQTRSRMRTAMRWIREQPPPWQVFARLTLPPNHRDWMDIYRRSTMYQLATDLLQVAACPVAISAFYNPAKHTTAFVLFIWRNPAPNWTRQRVLWIPATGRSRAFGYQLRPYNYNRQDPEELDWTIDNYAFQAPLTTTDDPLSGTYTIEIPGDTPPIYFFALPEPPTPLPTNNAQEYPLTPLYRSTDFPALPTAPWPPPPGANILEYTSWTEAFRQTP